MITVPDRMREGAINLGKNTICPLIWSTLAVEPKNFHSNFAVTWGIFLGLFAYEELEKSGNRFSARCALVTIPFIAYNILSQLNPKVVTTLYLVALAAAVVFECFTKGKNSAQNLLQNGLPGAMLAPAPATLDVSAVAPIPTTTTNN